MESHVKILTEPVTAAACPKCGAMLEVPDIPAFTMVQCPTCEFEFPTPSKFGSFLLLQLLGMGGMGGVYRARDEALNREVAIKVMQKSLGDDPLFVETFQREAQAAAKLNHPNIAQVYSFGQVMGQPYIAMELIPGGSLDKMMASQGPLDPAIVFQIGVQIAEGLSEAADTNLVHGDVKPENILFDIEKNAKLVDFGLAAMQSGPNQEVWGTPYYIAPEKVRKQKTDLRSDIYSLGATLYHAIAGAPPFDGTDAAAVVKARFDGDPRPLRSVRKRAVPEEVEEIIKRMLSMDPAMRYPTYGSLLGDMRRYLSKAGPVSVASSGKKIMIKGKRPKTEGGLLPAGRVPIDQIEVEAENERELRKRKKTFFKAGCLGCGGVILLATLIGGGIFWYKASVVLKQAKAEMENALKKQAAASASIAKAVGEAKKFADLINASVTEAQKYANEAVETVVAVLGEEVRVWLIPTEPSYEIAPAEDLDAPAATAPAVETNVVANAADDAVEPAAAADDATERAAEEVSLGTIPEEIAKYPAVTLTRKMFSDTYVVKKAAVLAAAHVTEIEAMAKAAAAISESDPFAEKAEAIVGKWNAWSAKNAKKIQEDIQRASQTKKTLETVKGEARSIQNALQQAASDKAEAEKREAKLEKERLEREAFQAKTEGEIGQVREKENEIIPMLKQLQIREATRALRLLNKDIETTGGRDALAMVEERIKRIEEFHKFMVEKAPGFKSAKGWAIEAADDKTVTVGGKKILWGEIFESRMEIVAELVNGLVMNTQATKNLRLRERTRLETNAALCLSMFYSHIPAAVDRARQIARQAMENLEADSDIIKKLMPEFGESD
ncbi:MAG: protein kinase [Kiritimatiellaeota bacterium]|nr:protein kinase [Kiritimatiellota bacterium]